MDKVKIKKWMKNNIENHRDPITNEICATTLAEEAAQTFDLYEDDVEYVIPEEVFEISAEVSFEEEDS